MCAVVVNYKDKNKYGMQSTYEKSEKITGEMFFGPFLFYVLLSLLSIGYMALL